MNMGGYQNHDPLLGPLNTRYSTILRIQKGTINLTTTKILSQKLWPYFCLCGTLNPSPQLQLAYTLQEAAVHFKSKSKSRALGGSKKWIRPNGLYDLHHRSIRVQNGRSVFWILPGLWEKRPSPLASQQEPAVPWPTPPSWQLRR